MARFHPLLALLLAVLLAVPAAPVTAGTRTPAAPADPPVTFNVTRLGVYDFPPNYDSQHVTADGNQAFLTNGTTVNSYDITDPYAPSFKDSIPGDTGYAVVDIDANADSLARLRLARLSTNSGIDIVLKVYDVSGGTFTPHCSLHFDWSTWSFPQTVLIHDSGRYVYVGFSQGLAVVDIQDPVNGACKAVEANHDPKLVSDIVLVGDKLYLAAATDVVVFSVAEPSDPRDPVSYAIAAEQTYRVAVSDNGAIFAATVNPWGLTVIYDGAYGTYPQTGRVSVVADDNINIVFVGTDQDLQVVDAFDLQKPLPIKLPMIGRYRDYYAHFYVDLAVNWGLDVHSPMGIFHYRPDLWLQALSPGITKDGTTVPEGTGVTITDVGDRVGVSSPDGKAALAYRCSESKTKTVVGLLGRDRTPATVTVATGLASLAQFGADECGIALPSPPSASPEADPPALPLTLESGGLAFDVLATVGAIQVATTNASSRAGGGTRFEAAHDPSLGVSQFVCLAGTLQVQPTATGAPLLTLGPGQFVDVTAAGAGPVGQFRYVYLPLLRR